jgi:NADPH-dependent 2,4-dienoyl-CoA reductase/sulfur reductase-like enzyme
MTTSPQLTSVVVVGASAAGLAAAESLRRLGFSGELTVVGDEVHLPYDRPPLSKQVLKGEWPDDRVTLRRPEGLEKLGASWRLGVAATGLDVARRTVTLSDGTAIDFDGLVIATGVSARHLPADTDLARVHILRTLDDAVALRTDLQSAGRLAVVGAGFLGSEVAAVACELGLAVTLIDPLSSPMHRQLGPQAGALVAALHKSRGVDLRLGVGVRRLTGLAGAVTGLDLTDGTHVEADVVVVGIGSTPNTEWLADSGLDLGNGVVCDEYCRATDGIVAAGDVASWHHVGLERRLRLEHRTNAGEHGAAAARALLDPEAPPFVPVPFFWSDQFDVKLQVYGLPSPDDEVRRSPASVSDDRFALTYVRDDRVVAGLAWNMPKEALSIRAQVLHTFRAG